MELIIEIVKENYLVLAYQLTVTTNTFPIFISCGNKDQGEVRERWEICPMLISKNTSLFST